MLFEIRHVDEVLRLYVARKKGLQFKRKFKGIGGVLEPWVHQAARDFADRYLRLSCHSCKERGWVYKTRMPAAYRSSLKGGRKSPPPEGVITVCPECQTRHLLHYEKIPFIYEGVERHAQLPLLTPLPKTSP